jgi:hypothetical protein
MEKKMSDAKKIGTELVSLCQQGKNIHAIEKYYADAVVSVEAAQGQGFPRELKGKQEVLGKSKWWVENHKVHSAEASGPFPHGDDRFAVIFKYDVTNKLSKQRFQMQEVAVYYVSAGKILREEFFYST